MSRLFSPKVRSAKLGKFVKSDIYLFVSAMEERRVHCASLVNQSATPFVIFHEQVGRFHTDWHQHPQEQFIFAEQGCIHLHGQDRRLLVPRGYGVWIPGDTDHEMWSTNPQLQMRSIGFPAREREEQLSSRIHVFPVNGLLREMVRYTERWVAAEKQDGRVDTFIETFRGLLSEEFGKAPLVFLPSTTHPRLSPVLALIGAHLSEKMGIQWLAKEFGMSERTLNRLFAQELRLSFSSYCKRARMMKALELIEQGCDSVSDLAFGVGYQSVATFSNNFLEICGNRPLGFIHKD